jgi:hypothetical protein
MVLHPKALKDFGPAIIAVNGHCHCDCSLRKEQSRPFIDRDAKVVSHAFELAFRHVEYGATVEAVSLYGLD